MKISKRRFEKKMAAVRWQALGNGQERGRQEMADWFCSWIDRRRAGVINNPPSYNATLHIQAYAEGMRLLAYFYDETSLDDLELFKQRFIDSRKQDTSSVFMFRADENNSCLPHIVITGGANAAG